jgi:Phycobilisome protein
MLTNLARLSVEIDGRYATKQELKFLTDYFNTMENRFSAYEKLSLNLPEIIEKVLAKTKLINPNLLIKSQGDVTEICQRDLMFLLRSTTAALLFDDQDTLQEDMLLWHGTIAKSFQFSNALKTIFEVMPEVVKEYLTPEEMALFAPLITLNKISLSTK